MQKIVDRECKKHGLTNHVAQKNGRYVRYRCKKCNTENVTNWRRNVKTKLVAAFGAKCSLCGYDKCQEALQFHHLDPDQKSFGIAAHGNTRSFETIMEEAKKCVLICANCHAEVEAGVTNIDCSVVSMVARDTVNI